MINQKPIHPGKILFHDYMRKYEMTLKELNNLLKMDAHTLRLLVLGKVDIDDKIAHKLASIFDTSSQYWMNLQSTFNKGVT
jgi:addiction module HigA family antidote